MTEEVNSMRGILRKTGFFMLGILSLLYIVFSKDFAKMRLEFSFLNFPVFVGEILLFTCLISSFFVFDFRSIKGRQWIVVFYFLCVILKALQGYSLWGPLAFRHAALFYYLVFIFFGFIFYKKSFFSEPLKIFIVSLILVLCVTKYFHDYWVLALWAIAFILIKSFRRRAIKYLFYAALLSTIFLSYKLAILTSRTFVVGNIAAVVFLIIAVFLIAKIRIFYKAVIAGVIFILLAAFVVKHSSANASGTIFDIKGNISRFKETEEFIKARRPFHVSRCPKKVKLFNPEKAVTFELAEAPSPVSNAMPQIGTFEKRDILSRGNIKQNEALALASDVIFQKKTSGKKDALSSRNIGQEKAPAFLSNAMFYNGTFWKNDILLSRDIGRMEALAYASDAMFLEETPGKKGTLLKPAPVERPTESAYGNSVYRLFIWRDMIVEFSQHWPIFGFSFGKPLRSESLEIMELGTIDWLRDGWLEAHNAYLDILYRMGILGVALLGFLIWQFCSMVKSFIALESLSGILLCSILINWLVAANFLPILELPYNAIPIWALWGMALGYLKELKDRQDKTIEILSK